MSEIYQNLVVILLMFCCADCVHASTPEDKDRTTTGDLSAPPPDDNNPNPLGKNPMNPPTVTGNAAFKSFFRKPNDAPSKAEILLQKALDARAPGTAWNITQLSFTVDRWAFFETTLMEGYDVSTERYAVDSLQGVVKTGDMEVLGEILRTLDILDTGTTTPFNLARIAASVNGSRGRVLSAGDIRSITSPTGMHAPSLVKTKTGAQLLYWEEKGARGLSYTRCQLDITTGYRSKLSCSPHTPVTPSPSRR